MNISKLSFALLAVAVIWLAGSVFFFILHFTGTGMLPLSTPILMLVLAAAFFAAFLRFRKLGADIKRKK